ncbi:MAG: ABC transporter permease [Spirochaetales bacterium]|nr:ABC transporter permease [Spirochaetales bacterium]
MIRGGVLVVLLGLLSVPLTLGWILQLLLGKASAVIYPLEAPWALILEHGTLVTATTAVALLLGTAGAVWAYAKPGTNTRKMLSTTGALLQTVPPVAFLALAVPILGFGSVPVFWALVAFAVLPIFHGTLAALDSLPPGIQNVAVGLGFSRWQRLIQIELPLAVPGIKAGLGTSVMINIGTATIGATMGAGGLGRPIIAGISEFQFSYLLQGALTAGVLALFADWALSFGFSFRKRHGRYRV